MSEREAGGGDTGAAPVGDAAAAARGSGLRKTRGPARHASRVTHEAGLRHCELPAAVRLLASHR